MFTRYRYDVCKFDLLHVENSSVENGELALRFGPTQGYEKYTKITDEFPAPGKSVTEKQLDFRGNVHTHTTGKLQQTNLYRIYGKRLLRNPVKETFS